jgi:hypothetical protein
MRGVDVGVDNETVSNGYNHGDNEFTGKIMSVTVDLKSSTLISTDKKTMEDVATTIED